MEVEQTETVEVAETPEPVVEPEVRDQDQINEWLDDRLGPETEVEEVEAVEEVEPEVEAPEPEVTEQDQISEWLDDRIGPETEAEESQESQESQPVEEPETAAAEDEITRRVVETPRVSKAFSKVAKKEREVQQQRQDLNKLKAELEPLRKAKERADKGDYLGALDGIGWNYESATNQVLQDGKLQETKAEPAALTPEVEGRLAKLETMERQKQIDSYVNRMKTKVEGDERFELVKDNWQNAWPTILEMQKIVAQETGTIKQDEEILLEVENFYEQQAQSLAKSSKMKKLFQPEAGLPEKPSDSPRIRKTLRNKITASQPVDKGAPKSRRERLEAALATYGSNL